MMEQEVKEALEQLRADLTAMVEELREQLAALERTLQSRTEHLV